MEQLLVSDQCERPQHARVDDWGQPHHGRNPGVHLWIIREWPRVTEIDRFRRASKRRAEKWWNQWHATPVVVVEHIVNAKLEEAKMRRFTEEGKEERIAKAMAALDRPVSIKLKPEAWREALKESYFEDPC